MLTSMFLLSIRSLMISIFPFEAAKCNAVFLIYFKTSLNIMQNIIVIFILNFIQCFDFKFHSMF